jgi:hypothetical protein
MHLRHARTAFRPLARRVASALLLLSAGLGAAGCAGGDTPTAPGITSKPPTGPDPVLKGSMVLHVTGLPAGVAGDVSVTGPGGFARTATATVTLPDIDAGRYTVTARAIRTADGVLAPVSAEQVIDIGAGAPPLLVSVSYVPAQSIVGVTVSGLPGGASAVITLRQPSGGDVDVSATSRVTGAAGQWSITAGNVKAGGFTYVPTPRTADGVVQPGDSLGFQVQHALATGAIAVAVSGLPAGASASYTVTGPSGTTRSATSSATFTDLEPGLYTIAAPSVDASGGRFRPIQSTVQVVVTPSLVATPAAISYAPVTSTLVLSVSGAPSGASEMVRVLGPNGYIRAASGSTTLAGLAPGTYAIAAMDIVQPVATWRASPATVQRTLEGDATDSVTLAYAVATGSIAVTVSGLPSNATALVTVNGPGGFARAMTASGTLVGLVPGVYSVSAAAVSAGGESYSVSPATQSVTVAASLVASPLVVSYRARAATLVVRIAGAPGGAQEMVRVTGPNNFDRSLTTSTTLDGLAPGTYTVTANEIVQPSAIWRASPSTAQRTLALDARDSVDVQYAVASGSIAVSVSGLPSGTNANMQLSGPNGYLVPVTGTSTFVRLTPGVYGLAGSSVSSGGTQYSPTPPTQQIVVNASLTASGASVSYVSNTASAASLVIAIMGSPPGGSPSVQVNGPSGFSRVITSTTTLSGLAPGVYTTSASAFNIGSSSYSPSPQSAQRTLSAGGRDSVGVTYSSSAPATGQLAVTVSGLPAGTNAAITLTGNGTSHTITGSTTVSGLTAGSYSLAASSVTSGSTTYNPTPTSQSVNVTAGATSNASVTYSAAASPPPPAGDDLSVEFAYLTQAVQRPDGSVPLVAGRDALLRVFVINSRTNILRPDVRVRIYDGATLLQTISIPAPELSVRTTTAEGTLSSTWNTVVPASFVRTSLRILADVDPGSSVASDGDRTNNVWPRGGTPQAITVNSVPPLNIRFVPVTIGALSGNVSSANVSQFLQSSRLMHPLSTINADVRLPFVSSAEALQSGDGNNAWLTVLSEMNALRSTDNAPATTHYYGVVKVTYSSGVAGYGYVPGRAAVGWDYLPSGDGVALHELGHNFSRPHSPCGVSGDPSYPYANGAIGFYGWNSTSNSLVAPSATDYMGYCSNNWVSDWTWSRVMAHRQSSGVVAAASVAGTDARANDGLLVWGRIVNGRVLLEPAFRVNARPTPRAATGGYRVQALDADGATLLDLPIDAPLVDHTTAPERQFAVVVPWSAALDASLASLRVQDVRSPLSAALRTSDAARRAGAHAGAVRIRGELPDPAPRVERAAGRDRLRWNSTAYPMALVRDVATGQTIAFLRGTGDGYLAQGRAVDLVLSDGVRSVTRRVAPGGQPE